MLNDNKLAEYVEEAKECLNEALDLLNTMKKLVRDAKPMVESEFQMECDISRFAPLPEEDQKVFDSKKTRSELWLERYKDLFPNEA